MYFHYRQTVTAEIERRSDEILLSGIKDFYVYAIVRSGEIVYIGKGSGIRICRAFLEHQGDDCLFLYHGLPNRLALAQEKELIRKVQPVDNYHHKSPFLR